MLNIVLYEPEIPENTGNIARMCVGLNATLHLIKPFGFFLDDKHMKRSGLDYWKHLNLIQHDSYDDFLKYIKPDAQIYYLTRYGIKTPDQLQLNTSNPTYFIFGKESLGIPKVILKDNREQTVRIPASENVRSLNLANCVAILGYEYVKQNKYKGLATKEPHKPLF
jgi:tRNA (cytidine/uridine-2'-O-)-methyltransferase